MHKKFGIVLAAMLAAVPMYYTVAEEEWDYETYDLYDTSAVVAEDIYDFRLRLKVPQVRDNTESLGYRKYEWQTIKGKMYIVWKEKGGFQVMFGDLENSNFKVRGAKVRYTGSEDRYIVSSHFNWIGNNKKDVFKTPCICFYLVLEPSYAAGRADEDNSFYVLLSGSGKTHRIKGNDDQVANRLSGYATGTQGCGCMLYGHKSPTRQAEIHGPSDTKTSDVVATYGTWRAVWKRREIK